MHKNTHLMSTFMYNYMLPKYCSERVNLLMTDTDSFLFEIHDTKTDLYMGMKDALHWFDTSSYPVDHFSHSEKIKRYWEHFMMKHTENRLKSSMDYAQRCIHSRCMEKKRRRRQQMESRCVLENTILLSVCMKTL